MKRITFGLALVAACTAMAPPAAASRSNDQAAAREHSRSGKEMKLKEIEARILPKMRGMEYLGPEYDSTTRIYRLKFIDSGRVIFVDVDARNGNIVRQR